MADNQDPNITLAQLLQNSESARQAQKDLQQQIEASQTAQRDYNLLMEEANEQMRIAADLFRRGAISFEQYNEARETFKTQQREIRQGLQEEEDHIKRLTKATQDLNEAQKIRNEYLGDAADIIKTALGPELSKLAGSTKDLTKEFIANAHSLDDMRVGLAKQTGMGSQFNAVAIKMASSSNQLNLSLKTSHQVLGDLSLGYSTFNALSRESQAELGELVGYYQHLGVAAADSARAIDLLDRSMGFSQKSAQAAFDDFEALADSVGMSYSEVVKGFNELGDELARFGREAPQVFADLQKEARSLGMSVKQAFDISEQFDTFQGSADVAGKLNAQLGLQLNSVAIMATENSADRIKMLRQEFEMQGMNVDNLDRRQKQMIAEIMKVPVGMVDRMFGDPMEMRKYQRDEEKRQERLDKYMTASMKLAEVWEEMFISIEPALTSFIEGLKVLADVLSPIVTVGSTMFIMFGKIAGSIGTLVTKMKGAEAGARAIGVALKGVAVIGGVVTGLINGLSTGDWGYGLMTGAFSLAGSLALGAAGMAIAGPPGAIIGAMAGGILGEQIGKYLYGGAPKKKDEIETAPIINDYNTIGLDRFNKDDLHLVDSQGRPVAGGTSLFGQQDPQMDKIYEMVARASSSPSTLTVNVVLDDSVIDTKMLEIVKDATSMTRMPKIQPVPSSKLATIQRA